jgi:oleate hydratase
MVWWGFALYPDRVGNYVKKSATDCSGTEVLKETLRHIGLEKELSRVIEKSICNPCILPYAGSVWLARSAGDRPKVVPEHSTNFGFVGQFAEVPLDACFTMEYAIRTAREAVAELLKLEHKPPPVYQGQYDPEALYRAAQALT